MKLEDAIVLATLAHRDQVDRVGEPFIRHPLRVMEAAAPDREAMVVAVVHDVLEDTGNRFAARLAEGLSPDQWHALGLLTRGKDEEYEDYIVRMCEASRAGTLSRGIKLLDLDDNLDEHRLARIPDSHKRMALRGRYLMARRVLCMARGGVHAG